MQALKKYQASNKIPDSLFYKIKRFIDHGSSTSASKDSEKFMNDLPRHLRDEVTSMTHGNIITTVDFFQNKSDRFNQSIVYQLQPIYLQPGEMLYQTNDAANAIYFIYQGGIRLMIDMNEYREEEYKLNNKSAKGQEIGEDEEDILGGSSSLKGIIQYVEKSYFGDSDIFAKEAGLNDSGRDSTAFTVNDRGECSVFVMDLKVFNIIKSSYQEIYE